jgi:hypothetical protein
MPTTEAVAVDGHRYIYEVDNGPADSVVLGAFENCACANTYWEVDR